MPSGKQSEAAIVADVRLAWSNAGGRIFRNNVGQLYDRDGRIVRYGLCVGSSDLIGWRPVTITPEMVGQTIAQFAALEVKRKGGKPTGDQVRFIKAVQAAGGLAGVVTSADEALAMLEG
jgi:hypothetical protein